MMRPRGLLLIALLIQGISLAQAADEAPWVWAGIEILGNHAVPRSQIEPLISVPIGEASKEDDVERWGPSCEEVKRKFDLARIECGTVKVFQGRKVYLIVDIIEKGSEERVRFRKPPSKSIPFEAPELVAVSEELGSKTMKSAIAGHPYTESGEKGYLTYIPKRETMEDMSPLVEKLAAEVPKQRANLLEVLRHEKSPEQRRQAATLLNWARGDLEDLLDKTIPLLDDPDAGVRNNLSRFMIHFVGQVKSKGLRHRLTEAFVVQLEMPSHGDRNKGLYNLLEITKAWPDELAYLKAHGRVQIEYLAKNSILFNVKGPAEELLALIDGHHK